MSTYAFTMGALSPADRADVAGWLARAQREVPGQIERIGETESVLRLAATVLGDRVRITVYKTFGRVRLEGANVRQLAAQLGLAIVTEVVRALPGGATAPVARVAVPAVGAMSQLRHAGTLHARLTSHDAADVPGWLDRARADLEGQGGKVHVEPSENLLVAEVDQFDTPVKVAVALEGDSARMFLYGNLPATRVPAYLSWLADLLELTPTGAPEVHAPTATVQFSHRRSGGKASGTFASSTAWDIAPDDLSGALGDLLT